MEFYKQVPLDNIPKYVEDYIRSCNFESIDVPLMSPDARVSIIIPAYNESSNILGLLSCLEKQFTNRHELHHDFYEIILVDNYSTDETPVLVKEYIKNNRKNNVYLISEKRKGVSFARKTGMDLALKRSIERSIKAGKYIPHYLFCSDADDQLNDKWVWSIFQKLESNLASAASCDYIYPESAFYNTPRLHDLVRNNWFIRRKVKAMFGGCS